MFVWSVTWTMDRGHCMEVFSTRKDAEEFANALFVNSHYGSVIHEHAVRTSEFTKMNFGG